MIIDSDQLRSILEAIAAQCGQVGEHELKRAVRMGIGQITALEQIARKNEPMVTLVPRDQREPITDETHLRQVLYAIWVESALLNEAVKNDKISVIDYASMRDNAINRAVIELEKE